MSPMSNFFEKSDISRSEAENVVSQTLQKCDERALGGRGSHFLKHEWVVFGLGFARG